MTDSERTVRSLRTLISPRTDLNGTQLSLSVDTGPAGFGLNPVIPPVAMAGPEMLRASRLAVQGEITYRGALFP